jgi:hypothetical protein
VGQAVEETVVTPAAAQTDFNIRVLLNTKFLIIICTSITITLRYLLFISVPASLSHSSINPISVSDKTPMHSRSLTSKNIASTLIVPRSQSGMVPISSLLGVG